MAMNELVSTERAAQLLGLKSCTLNLWRSHGQGPSFIRLSGKAIRYKLSTLEKYAADRTVRFSNKKGKP